eukprot:3374888-Lingulodinium_polyedra.AAC.1
MENASSIAPASPSVFRKAKSKQNSGRFCSASASVTLARGASVPRALMHSSHHAACGKCVMRCCFTS